MFIVDFKPGVTLENATKIIEKEGLSVYSHKYVSRDINGTNLNILEIESHKTLWTGEEKKYIEALEQNECVLEVSMIPAIT